MMNDTDRAMLRLLDRALVLIRAAAQDGDLERVEAIADAVHNVPSLMALGALDVPRLREAYVRPLIAEWPELGPQLDFERVFGCAP